MLHFWRTTKRTFMRRDGAFHLVTLAEGRMLAGWGENDLLIAIWCLSQTCAETSHNAPGRHTDRPRGPLRKTMTATSGKSGRFCERHTGTWPLP